MHTRIAIVIAAGIAACGGSDWSDPTTGHFSKQDSADILSLMNSQNFKNPSADKETVVPCPGGGTASAKGDFSNLSPRCNESSCPLSGRFHMAYSNCADANGLVMNGPMEASISLDLATFSATGTMTGTVSVSRNGSSLGVCGINLASSSTISADGSTTEKVSGTACGQKVDETTVRRLPGT